MWIFLFFVAGGILGGLVMFVAAAGGRSELEMEKIMLEHVLQQKDRSSHSNDGWRKSAEAVNEDHTGVYRIKPNSA
ncbi:MAG TPA: hypothetical protein VKA68_10630 [bacterium]|nr:hypothetical protein [bacterium]